MDRILRNTGALLQVTFYVDETATDADGSVTVTITGEDGSAVDSGTATSAGSGVYTFVLDPQASLDVLETSWSGAFSGVTNVVITRHEIVGERLASVSEVRALDGMSDTTVFPTATIEEGIRYAEDLVAEYCGTPFVARYARDRFNGDGRDRVRLANLFPSAVIDVTENGSVTAGTSSWVLLEDGHLVRDDGTGFTSPTSTYPAANCEVRYEHGLEPTPVEIRWAARTLARQYVLDLVSRVPDRALQIQSDFGQITLAQAGAVTRPSSLPDVNAVLNRHRHRPPSVG